MAKPDGRIEAGQNLRTAVSAAAWNRAQDAADIVLGARGGVQGGPQQAGPLPYTWCLARNDSGSDVPRWGVLAITGMEIEPTSEAGGATAEFERLPVVTGDTPSDGDAAWCVAVEPIAAGKVGRVAVAGVVQCKVLIQSETDYFVKAGDTVNELVTGADGDGVILWKEDSTGSNKWALIRFGSGPRGMKLGKTLSDWNTDSLASINVYTGESGSETYSGETIENCVNKFGDIPANAWVVVANFNDAWYAVEAERDAQTQTIKVLTGATLAASGLILTAVNVKVVEASAAENITIDVTDCGP
jgi:hypothetical protein